MSRRRRKAEPGGEDCTPMMDYAPSIVESLDNGILHGDTQYGSYGDIYIPTGGTCHIRGCDEPCGADSRYCEGHKGLGRVLKSKARHSKEVAKRLLAERKQAEQCSVT